MPHYPRVEPYVALLQEDEDEAELDCGCLIGTDSTGTLTVLYFCTLHNAAQQLLDVLDKVAIAAYQNLVLTVRCGLCGAARRRGVSIEPMQHDEDCPMNLVHEAIRTAKLGPKGGDAQQAVYTRG